MLFCGVIDIDCSVIVSLFLDEVIDDFVYYYVLEFWRGFVIIYCLLGMYVWDVDVFGEIVDIKLCEGWNLWGMVNKWYENWDIWVLFFWR